MILTKTDVVKQRTLVTQQGRVKNEQLKRMDENR